MDWSISTRSVTNNAAIGMTSDRRADNFISLYTAHEARLRAFILSLVPRWSDAEEIAQRCSMILWKKFDQFELGTSFFAWACQIARLEVKEYRKKAVRQKVLFTDAFVDAVANEVMEMQAELPLRLRVLQKCVEKLQPKHRELLRLRYDESKSVKAVARTLNRSVDAVYKGLSRIRQALFECINRALAAGDA
jgi:RNA polymerase sigma-70 factor, ECF subfamily